MDDIHRWLKTWFKQKYNIRQLVDIVLRLYRLIYDNRKTDVRKIDSCWYALLYAIIQYDEHKTVVFVDKRCFTCFDLLTT